MCLPQVVSCTLSCIPTVQSYDKVSVPARGFRPGAASFPTCRAIWPSPRVCALTGVSQWMRDTRFSRAFRGGGEWVECIKAVEKQHPRMAKLKMEGRLEPLEYRVCVLVKLGMKVNDIIFLTETTHSKISTMRSRLHQKLFGEKGGAKGFDQRMAEV